MVRAHRFILLLFFVNSKALNQENLGCKGIKSLPLEKRDLGGFQEVILNPPCPFFKGGLKNRSLKYSSNYEGITLAILILSGHLRASG
jgi:hypothetical protein